MAQFILNSLIKIEGYKAFPGVHEVTITKSIRNYNDTAVVKLPTTAALKQKGEAPTKSIWTAQAFKRGDRINIQLGYNGQLREEFDGFISRVNKTTPCEIECEGYAFQLREKQVSKVYRNTTLKTVLTELIAGTDIVLSDQMPEVKIDKLPLLKTSGFKALSEIQKECGGIVAIWFRRNVLYAGLALEYFSKKAKVGKADVKFKIGYNVVRDGQMKERMAGDNAYEVEVIYKNPDGKKNTARVGLPNSNTIRKRVSAIKDEEFRHRMADEVETSKNYTGFDGKITAFLQPFCLEGDKMAIEDPKYPERSGNYLIESIKVKYGRSGARREIKISIKL